MLSRNPHNIPVRGENYSHFTGDETLRLKNSHKAEWQMESQDPLVLSGGSGFSAKLEGSGSQAPSPLSRRIQESLPSPPPEMLRGEKAVEELEEGGD